jgi:hypothetical protein
MEQGLEAITANGYCALSDVMILTEQVHYGGNAKQSSQFTPIGTLVLWVPRSNQRAP